MRGGGTEFTRIFLRSGEFQRKIIESGEVEDVMRLLPVLRKGERVLAAVSGGPDSVCLLRLLCTLCGGVLCIFCARCIRSALRGGNPVCRR